MNTHINRWKSNHEAVQKLIDELPDAKDATDEVDQTKERGSTDTEHANDDQEEVKDSVNAMTRTPLSAANEPKTIASGRTGQQSFAG
jgi:hypothetical protein